MFLPEVMLYSGQSISQRINDGLRDQIGARTLIEVVAGERDQLMLDLTSELNETTASDIGFEVIDVRVKRIDLPDDVRSSVYDRMITERNRRLKKYAHAVMSLPLALEQMRIVRLLSMEPKPIAMPKEFAVKVTLKQLESMRKLIRKMKNSLLLLEASMPIARLLVPRTIYCC
ncbi:MAG: hypothetical protein Ct9H300mP22_6380 [Gammaproteobacteria bacterium]|nr:MAG: hypothetical protein Ct9H300mP22_6380 [Gammaproteobacteria bacterium]